MSIRSAAGCFAVLLLLVLASGCTPVGLAVGTAAGVGVASAQDRGLGGVVEDTRIRAEINERWAQADEVLWREVSLQVQEGRVLLTGTVPDQDMRLEAVRLAWQVQGVKEVINEIEVVDSEGLDGYALDTWISTQLKTKLLLDEQIYSLNYSVETVNRSVYLMGFARDQAELERVVQHARYVRLLDTKTRQAKT
jgi:osmotically-inducible protein OsmY